MLLTPSTYIWAVASDSQGNAYVATGSPATVLKVTPAGASTKLFSTKELTVQTVRVGPDGSVYAATVPGGKVYRIKPGQSGLDETTATVVFDSATAAHSGAGQAGRSGPIHLGSGLRRPRCVIHRDRRTSRDLSCRRIHRHSPSGSLFRKRRAAHSLPPLRAQRRSDCRQRWRGTRLSHRQRPQRPGDLRRAQARSDRPGRVRGRPFVRGRRRGEDQERLAAAAGAGGRGGHRHHHHRHPRLSTGLQQQWPHSRRLRSGRTEPPGSSAQALGYAR